MQPTHEKPKWVYLDVCSLCRPFDDQRQIRIQLETRAVELIFTHVRQDHIKLIISAAHTIEIEAIGDLEERTQLMFLRNQLGTRPKFNLIAARQRAKYLVSQGLGIADATHLAFAEQVQAEFVTVDDRLMKRYQRTHPIIWCGSPIAYCEKENLK
ncbi:MAG: hypothetical protein KJ638_10785 [Chloroflexi bacterium]|nr:hypothetical protein [Chloroflexota bacterium]